MSIAPLPQARVERLGTQATHTRRELARRRVAGRRRRVLWTKRLLPVLALLLLGSLAAWPEISRQFDNARLSFRRGGLSGELKSGRLLNLRYHGQDVRNRPYTVTAERAVQVSPERIDLSVPKADLVSENGSWTYVESKQGVYRQHVGQLDMSGDVTLYRDDGVTMTTQSTAMDMKQGAAAGNEPVHVEGPFGTLDAKGFALVDKGTVIQFDGKSRLLLNGTHR